MELQLDAVELRVLGCLLEKEAATPEYYPLSLSALVNACNQRSNRDPVTAYDADTVEQAIERLCDKGLAGRNSDARVAKYSHRLAEVFNLGRRESAVLCELVLRGPQTPGELRSRTERMYRFDDLASVEGTLNRLMEREPEPLAVRLPRQAGSREARFAHLLAGEPDAVPAPVRTGGPPEDVLRQLQAAVDALAREVEEIRRELSELRARRP